MLPTFPDDLVHDFKLEELPTETFRVDFDQGRIVGRTDGLDAMKQAIYLALATERFAHEIYSWNYGSELAGLVGMQPPLVYVRVKDAIINALMPDDRILAVEEFDFEQTERQVHVTFRVQTNQGPIPAEYMVVI